MFDWIGGLIEQFGVWGFVFLMFLENVFPPIPSEVILPLAGYSAATGRMALWVVLIGGTAGSVLGAIAYYELARLLGRERFLHLVERYGFWLTISTRDAERALDWFQRWGGWAVFLARMMPAVRTLISVPAGLSGMNRFPFLALTILGSAIWVSFLVGMGYLLEAEYHRVEDWLNPVTNIVLATVLIVYVWRVVQQLWLRRRQRSGG